MPPKSPQPKSPGLLGPDLPARWRARHGSSCPSPGGLLVFDRVFGLIKFNIHGEIPSFQGLGTMVPNLDFGT